MLSASGPSIRGADRSRAPPFQRSAGPAAVAMVETPCALEALTSAVAATHSGSSSTRRWPLLRSAAAVNTARFFSPPITSSASVKTIRPCAYANTCVAARAAAARPICTSLRDSDLNTGSKPGPLAAAKLVHTIIEEHWTHLDIGAELRQGRRCESRATNCGNEPRSVSC